MKARVDKYNNNEESYAPKRTHKNEQLYEEIKDAELENFTIGSNAKVLGENSNHIDIDKIKEILEKNYQEVPKRRSQIIPEVEEESYEMEKTREYDINAILEKAREEKEVDYQEERLKKVRDTQYDILKNLELDSDAQKNKAANEKTKEELLDLINTINMNEETKKYHAEKAEEEDTTTGELDPLDILSDLKGDEDTVVVGNKEFTEEMNSLEVDVKKLKQEEVNEVEDEDTIDKSFYTTTGMSFSKEDFADFDDLEKGSKIGSIAVKCLIVLIFLAIIFGIVLFLNDFLKLGWF